MTEPTHLEVVHNGTYKLEVLFMVNKEIESHFYPINTTWITDNYWVKMMLGAKMIACYRAESVICIRRQDQLEE
jgi:hypothetical protein